MAVKVQFEIGHISKLRAKKTPEGFTHDWELHVQGVNKVDISSFVDKIVFNLHKTFPKPKRVLKEPPYIIQESGYAGFLLPIDIYFRSREEPKKFEFTYDLHLQRMGPPHQHSEIKNFIFENPSDEFRQKLLKGGGVPVAGVVSASGGGNTQSTVDEGMVSKPKLSIDSVTKKHKSRTDESKMNTFADLFGTPITTANSAKHSPDNRVNSVGAKSGGNSITSNSSNNIANPKDKSHKEREKSSGSQLVSGSGEKIRDKAEKKEKYKQSSPYKEQRGDMKKSSNVSENSKHEKRSEEKSKKDKSRDKERGRSRDKGGNSMKRGLSPKGSNRNLNQPSPKRMTPPSSGSRASVAGSEESRSASVKMDIETKVRDSKSKETSSNSSNKKSKKEKKDKDKERDRDKDKDKERRDDHKHRTEGKMKDDRGNISAGISTIAALSADAKDAKGTPPRNSSSNKKSDKDSKLETSKIKSVEKGNEKDAGSTAGSTPTNLPIDKRSSNSGNTVEKEKKSHKHKKKEKTKDKERERDREKDKEKDKSKDKEREKEKIEEKIIEKPVRSSSIELNNLEGNNSNQSVGPVAMKKSQNKEKKSKDKQKEDKRSGDVDSKLVKNAANSARIIPSSSHGNNLEMSDVDSPRSLQESVPTSLPNPVSAQGASAQYSDSSNSSFPDISSKTASTANLLPPPSLPTKSNTSSPSTKESRSTSKEQKQRNNEKNQKTMPDNAEKLEKVEKENKKRRRNSAMVNAFIEPPVKQTKKDQQAKIAREKSKSPLLRSTPTANVENGSSTFLQPSVNATTANTASSPITTPSTTPVNTNSSNVPRTSPGLSTDVLNNNTNNIVHTTTSLSIISGNNNSSTTISQSNSNNNSSTSLILPMDYMNELQDLHQKIMTLPDGEELQQVVEMIAATGCYEITSKTFDFDLCKLDRNTVQRLQDFFATSVS